MRAAPLFALQFLWFLIAWSILAAFVVGPAIRKLDTYDQLAVWVAPHLFRVLGVGLLVPNLSPGLPIAFAAPTAIGDSITAMLALVSLIALRRRWSGVRTLVWVFNLFGSADLLFAVAHAVRVEAALYLQAQWYVPALGVPLMFVAHFMVFRTLMAPREGAA